MNFTIFKKMNELSKRIIVSIIGLVGIFAAYYFEVVHHVLSILFFMLYSELLIACYTSKIKLWKKAIIFALGLSYMIFGLQSLLNILAFGYLLYVLAAVFIIDSSAYIFGKLIKGPLLAPKISPKKTWSGMITATIAGASMFYFFLAPYIFESTVDIFEKIAYGILFALVVQIGDLLVSWGKRILQIKDASNLLPGHGGFWDRCDSILAGAIFLEILRVALTNSLDATIF